MNKVLYIIRGIPGSGKSTLAYQLTYNVAEADQFMYENGEYKWHPSKLKYAHQQCFEKIETFMKQGITPIAVSNTFIKLKDFKPYVNLAQQYEYIVEIKDCDGNYGSIHDVPSDTMEKMKKKFQKYENNA